MRNFKRFPSFYGCYKYLHPEFSVYVPVIVMEYIENGTLRDRLEVLQFGNPTNTAKALVQIGLDIVDAVQSLHGMTLVHNNLNFKNIMYRLDGTLVLVGFVGETLSENKDTESVARMIAKLSLLHTPIADKFVDICKRVLSCIL